MHKDALCFLAFMFCIVGQIVLLLDFVDGNIDPIQFLLAQGILLFSMVSVGIISE